MVPSGQNRHPPSVRAVVQQLESLLQAGVTHLPRSRQAATDRVVEADTPQSATGATANGHGVGRKPTEPSAEANTEAVRETSSSLGDGRERVANISQPQEAAAMSKPVRSLSSEGSPSQGKRDASSHGDRAKAASASPRAKGPAPGRQKSIFDVASPTKPRLTREERIEALAVLQKKVAACTRCAELAATRTQTVFGVGNPEPRLCFLGEAPGADEDRLGEPFVGRAGQLLTRIIEACTLRREDVYILNILKCRPPGNRNPLPSEAANCRPFLDEQLEILQPEFICCLGSVAAQNLLATDKSIGKLRGQFYDYHGITVMCTYHPAYLLRNPNAKRLVWEDMQMLMARMGIELKR